MDWNLWLGFAVASLIVGLLPGPGVTSIVGYALTSGIRSALASVLGATLGNAIAMTFSLVGVGVLVQQWPAAFQVI
jgi:threonine/homoserine/homoserine lactone efflux protein